MTYVATITSKRQLTIPAELFSRFGLKRGQKVIIAQRDGKLVIKPMIALVESLAGSVPVPKRFQGLEMDQLIQHAKTEYFVKHGLLIKS